jgi:hypothetical protein
MHPLSAHPRGTVYHLLNHYVAADVVFPPLAIEPSVMEPEDIGISERLIEAFHRAASFEQNNIVPEKRPNDGCWEAVKHVFHGEAYKLIEAKDARAFVPFLVNGLRTNLAYGLGPGSQVYQAMATEGDGRTSTVLLLIDRLMSLAEALGVLPYENPEQGRYGKNMHVDPYQVAAMIEARIGMSISRPRWMGNIGFILNDGVFDNRVADDVYGVYRLDKILNSIKTAQIAEIGGGFGGMALFAVRAGAPHYVIVDLPIINVVQGYFLTKCLGERAVRLFGETKPDALIEVMPYWEFFDRNRRFDIVYNRDSFPEIPRARVDEYLDEIERRSVRLLSINQESANLAGREGLWQLRMNEIIADRDNIVCQSRTPYWMRRGYVEELYVPKVSSVFERMARFLESNIVPGLNLTSETTPRPPVDALPLDFDPENYLRLHVDVARAGVDPKEHYLTYGRREGRPYR